MAVSINSALVRFIRLSMAAVSMLPCQLGPLEAHEYRLRYIPRQLGPFEAAIHAGIWVRSKRIALPACQAYSRLRAGPHKLGHRQLAGRLGPAQPKALEGPMPAGHQVECQRIKHGEQVPRLCQRGIRWGGARPMPAAMLGLGPRAAHTASAAQFALLGWALVSPRC